MGTKKKVKICKFLKGRRCLKAGTYCSIPSNGSPVTCPDSKKKG